MKVAFIARKTLYSQPGGDTVHLEQTAHHLRQRDASVDVILPPTPIRASEYDLLHFFNLGRPADLIPYANLGLPLIISSIYVDYSAILPYSSPAIHSLGKIFGEQAVEYAKTLARGFLGADNLPPWQYILEGQKKSVQRVLHKARTVITATEAEQNLIRNKFQVEASFRKIALGLEHRIPSEELGGKKRDTILCVARIEPLKNQLNLVRACREWDDPLVLVGDSSARHLDYQKRLKAEAAGNISFAGNVAGENLPQYYRRAKVHVLPSFYESTGLASLEAMAWGAQIVVSDTAIQRELFGDRAHYCNPHEPSSIAAAISRAKADTRNHREWVLPQFSWGKAAESLLKIYDNCR